MDATELARAQRLLRAINAGVDADMGGFRERFDVSITATGFEINPRWRENAWAGVTATEALDKGEAWLRAHHAERVANARKNLVFETRLAESAMATLSEPL